MTVEGAPGDLLLVNYFSLVCPFQETCGELEGVCGLLICGGACLEKSCQ